MAAHVLVDHAAPVAGSGGREAALEEPVLAVEGVVKGFRRGPPWRRRSVEVLRGASLEVSGGELVGLVGENGSGKSTLMQIVGGLLARDAGTVKRPARLGYCPQLPLLWDKLKVAEVFESSRMGTHGGGDMGMSQHEMGMDMDPMILRFVRPFDRAYIDMMVHHYQGAIRMARAELAEGEQPALRKLAKDIIAAQTREIDQMRSWRKRWYGSGSGSMPAHGGGHVDDGSMMDHQP